MTYTNKRIRKAIHAAKDWASLTGAQLHALLDDVLNIDATIDREATPDDELSNLYRLLSDLDRRLYGHRDDAEDFPSYGSNYNA